MEAIYSSEKSVDFQRNTGRYIPEGSTLHNHRCENLKSYTTNQVGYTNAYASAKQSSFLNSSGTARIFSRDSPWKFGLWTGRPIRESWGVLWLVIRLLSVRADVSSSVRSILPCIKRLYCIPLHTCQHAGALPATTNTSTTRRRTVRTKYYYCTHFPSAKCNII
jgi:hypothetical protein